VHNGAFAPDKFGLKNLKAVNLEFWRAAAVRAFASCGRSGIVGGWRAVRGHRRVTGRSPRTSSRVRDATTDKNIGGTATVDHLEQFEALYQDFLKHAEGMTLFAQDLYGGADPPSHQDPRLHRTRLAFRCYPHAADPP